MIITEQTGVKCSNQNKNVEKAAGTTTGWEYYFKTTHADHVLLIQSSSACNCQPVFHFLNKTEMEAHFCMQGIFSSTCCVCVKVIACDRYRHMSGCRHSRNGYFHYLHADRSSSFECCRCAHIDHALETAAHTWPWPKQINAVKAAWAREGPVHSIAPWTCSHMWTAHTDWNSDILHVSVELGDRWARWAIDLSDQHYWPLDLGLNLGSCVGGLCV